MKKPGSKGEHTLQDKYGTSAMAVGFYDKQMRDDLNLKMKKFIARQEMVFIATSDSTGDCDCSFRAGEPGFVHVVDKKTLIYPEFQGNGVMASLGNILENSHIGMVFIDFFKSTVGLHVNGTAQLITNEELLEKKGFDKKIGSNFQTISRIEPDIWVLINVEEAYIHCSKHIPLLKKLNKKIYWGTEKEVHKRGNFFKVKSSTRPSRNQ